MRKILAVSALTLILFAHRLEASIPNPELVHLPASDEQGLPLGILKANLFEGPTEKVLASYSQKIGDCKGCTRGVALRGFLGLRVEGKDSESLRLSRKQSPGVKMLQCQQGGRIQRGQIESCTFEFEGQHYAVRLKIE
jgi:hypothetical protein